MSDISPIQRPAAAALNGVAKTARPDQPAEAKGRQSDRVELSDRARYLSQLKELPDIREDLVNSVREEIASDRYETEERIDAAINGLIDDLA